MKIPNIHLWPTPPHNTHMLSHPHAHIQTQTNSFHTCMYAHTIKVIISKRKGSIE